LLVIADKADLSKPLKLYEKGCISTETSAITDYAVNGALFYGKKEGCL
jgi:type I restriction enzyme M protein